MRYLLLSDIHSNLEAFDACLDRARAKYDQALCLGDLVGYGPDPNAVIEKTKPLATVIIRGNHDKACAGITDASDFNPLARWATMWTRKALTPEHFEFLRTLPPGPVMMDGVQLVHGSPLDEDDYILGAGEALPVLRESEPPIVCFGHTHYQGGFMFSPQERFQSIRIPLDHDGLAWTFSLDEGGRYLINPGSIGQPRDGDWRAAFAILDVDRKRVEYHRTPYDLAKTQQKMRQAGLPEPLIQRLERGR